MQTSKWSITVSHNFKGIVNIQIIFLSLFTHPRVVLNLYAFIFSVDLKSSNFEEVYLGQFKSNSRTSQ